jgi:hypothetical protein
MMTPEAEASKMKSVALIFKSSIRKIPLSPKGTVRIVAVMPAHRTSVQTAFLENWFAFARQAFAKPRWITESPKKLTAAFRSTAGSAITQSEASRLASSRSVQYMPRAHHLADY